MNMPHHQLTSSSERVSGSRTNNWRSSQDGEIRTSWTGEDTKCCEASIRSSLCATAIETLQDGFIVVDQLGAIQNINASAQLICSLLESPKNKLPLEIWQLCQLAFSHREMLSLTKIGIDAEIDLPGKGAARIRIQNFYFSQQLYWLIMIEDYQQTIDHKVVFDSVCLRLTEREVDVWKLRLKGSDYNDISADLEISANTVKKHIKSILAKRRIYRESLEEIGSSISEMEDIDSLECKDSENTALKLRSQKAWCSPKKANFG